MSMGTGKDTLRTEGKEILVESESQTYINGYMERARVALKEYEAYTQEQVDQIVTAVAKVVYDHAEELAEIAVEESGMGNVTDKIAKNKGKSLMIAHHLKDKKSVGIIERDESTGITKVAKPKGIVAAITPCTNPIVTPMSNAMFALKGRNVIIITPHHKAIKSSTMTVDLINEQLEKLGAPKNIIQILDQQSRENTKHLISSADVVVATGGMGMVKAAYSSGKPALGVGAGNVQCIIDKDANLEEVIPKIITGRAFDFGIICSAEQTVILPEESYEKAIKIFEGNGAYHVKAEERQAFRDAVFQEGAMNRHAVGQSPQTVGKLAGKNLESDVKVILIDADGWGAEDVIAKEKMCPVMAIYQYKDFKEAVAIAKTNLEVEGKGHSVSIHSNTVENIEYAGEHLDVSRFVVNQVCATSAGGSFHNGLAPTNTLGCGSWGNNSISENLDYHHLINISRIAYFKPDAKVPTYEETFANGF